MSTTSNQGYLEHNDVLFIGLGVHCPKTSETLKKHRSKETAMADTSSVPGSAMQTWCTHPAQTSWLVSAWLEFKVSRAMLSFYITLMNHDHHTRMNAVLDIGRQ